MRADLSHTFRRTALVPLFFLLLTPVTTGHAQGNEDSEARGLFLAGEAAFEGGRFEEALEHFERAYELSGRPELLYNIGTTAERLRIDVRAIEAYESYLEEIPESSLRANVEGRLRVLREQVERRRREARQERVPQPREPEPVQPPPPAEGGSSGLGWGLAAAGFGLLAGGALSLGLAAASRSAATDVDEGTPWLEVADDAERADRRAGIGIGLLAVGAVLGTVGLVLVMRAGGDDDDEVALRVGPAHLSIEGSF